MIDFDNREYLRISAYWKDWAVCFVMENGLSYIVSTMHILMTMGDSLKNPPRCRSLN